MTFPDSPIFGNRKYEHSRKKDSFLRTVFILFSLYPPIILGSLVKSVIWILKSFTGLKYQYLSWIFWKLKRATQDLFLIWSIKADFYVLK